MAGLIPPDKLEQIRAASDIVEIIGTYIPLKRAGANFVALCPFHREKSPSFNVNPQRQIFHCFGCHKGGDVFTFVKEHENIGFMDAVRRLAERARIPLEFEDNPAFAQTRQLKDRLLEIHEQITQRWQSALANDAAGQIARDYLAKRGVSEEAVKLFRLGYAPDLWDDTVNWAKSKNYELAQVEQAGLIIKKEGTDRHYDRFRGRLMFPICDEQGRVVAFSGRVLSGDEKTAKYVNSPETPIFTKGKVIFGLDKSKRALLDTKFAIVCEGQLDLIACFMAGVQNVVAPQGTAFTPEQARTLKRYVEEVVLCFDSDTAGQAAAIRSLDFLLASGLAIRVATIPKPHDPDSFIRANGGDAFKALIGSAKGFFDFYLDHLCAENDVGTDKGRLAIIRSMAAAVRKSNSEVLLDKYAQQTALRLGVTPDAARAEFKRLGKSAPATEFAEVETGGAEEASFEQAVGKPSSAEFWLLKLALTDDALAPWLLNNLRLEWITHPLVSDLMERRLSAERAGSWHGVASLLTELEGAPAAGLVTQTLAERRVSNDSRDREPEEAARRQVMVKDIILRLRNQAIDRQLVELTQRVSQPGITDAEQLALLQDQQRLRQLKRQPLA
jgi:DNA primase